MTRCRQLDRTLAIGTISRGTGTRLIRFALSTIAPVPVAHATEKKVYGTSPQSKNTGNLGVFAGKILVKTNVSTVIITIGFRSDQNAPSDMFRYRILKSFATSFRTTNS